MIDLQFKLFEAGLETAIEESAERHARAIHAQVVDANRSIGCQVREMTKRRHRTLQRFFQEHPYAKPGSFPFPRR